MMKNKIILVLVLISFFGFGQKIKYIETKTKNFGTYISQVQFIDTITGNIIKTIDVEKDNPFYKELPKPDSIYKEYEDTYTFLKYKDLPLDKIIPENNRKDYFNDTTGLIISEISLYRQPIDKTNTNCLISYNSIIHASGYQFGLTYIKVYNNLGKLIYKKLFFYGGAVFFISRNEIISCSFSQNTEYGSLFDSKLIIIDIKTDSILYSEKFTGVGMVDKINNNLITYSVNNKLLFYFKPNELKLYKKKNKDFVVKDYNNIDLEKEIEVIYLIK